MSSFLRICLSATVILGGATFAIADDKPAAPADGATAQTSAATPAPSAKDDPDKLICRREAMTGTRVATRRICLTRKEWYEVEHVGSEDARHMQRDQDARSKPIADN